MLLFGAMRDKALAEMLAALRPAVDVVIYARPAMSRAAEPSALAAISPGRQGAEVPRALDAAMREAGPSDLVVVAGSIFLVAEARAYRLGVTSQ